MGKNSIPIVTKNLLLRDFIPDDFEAFYSTTCDPEYQQFYPEQETTRSFMFAIFASILESKDKEPRMKYQLAVCQLEGDLIGTCGVRIEDTANQQASYGCAINTNYWGKAYAHEASQAILEYAFSSLPIHRIYAETIGDNWRARRLAERLGMRQEALLKETQFFHGRWWDTAVYAILRAEWQKSRTA
jgi:[ribosomal protein S5]-alanine N-acetyltransferase